jgi:predicted ATPase/DNA-binding SARP family transcriptional activator
MSPILQIQLLGDFRLFVDHQPLDTLNQPLLQARLAYLLLHRHAPQLRQQLAFTFWPDATDAQAHTNLRKVIFHLRQALPQADTFLLIDQQRIGWRADAPFTLDVAELEQALTTLEQAKAPDTTSVEQVLALYRGELLPTCYEDWLLVQRQALHERVVNGLTTALEGLAAQRAYTTAIRCAEHLLRLDPLHEPPYRYLMHLRALNGDRAGALRVYHTCATLLDQELGVPPAAETQALYEHLRKNELQPAAMASAPQPIQIPLVGRKREWETLQHAWREMANRGPHLLLVWGEAGMGKTRLVEELVHWASLRPGTVVYARSYAAEGDLAYAPVTAWLRSEPLCAALSQLDRVWRTELSRLLPELHQEYPDLPLPAPMSEGWQRQRFYEALARAVLAASPPVLLVLDDLQWCDEETLNWLRYLLRFDPQAPLLVVGTARTEEVDVAHPLHELLRQLQRDGQMTELTLSSLGLEETIELAHQVATEDVTAWTDQLYQETEGNPLFVVETVRAGFVKGHEQQSGSQRRVLPPTVHAVIATRLAQLSPPARQLAQLAATIGRAFTLDVLAAASDLDEDALVQGLDELWQRRIVREQATSYDFSHDKLREVVYTETTPARRRLLHSKLAIELERLHAERLAEMSSVIAVHYQQAQNFEKAGHYFQKAGQYAVAQFAHNEAIRHFSNALTCFPKSSLATRFQLLLLREETYRATGRGQEQQQDLEALQLDAAALDRELDTSQHQAEVAVRYSKFYERAGRYSDSATAATLGIQLARSCGAMEIEAVGYLWLGWALWAQGQMHAAGDCFGQVVTAARLGGNLAAETEALELLAAIGMFSGASEAQILDHLKRCLIIHQQIGTLEGQASILNKLGYTLMAQGNGRNADARAYYEQGLTLAYQVNDPVLKSILLSNLGLLDAYEGDYRAALSRLEKSLQLSRAAGNRMRQGAILNYLGFEARNRGDYDAALAYQEASLRITKGMSNGQWRTKGHYELSLVYHYQDKHEAAYEHAHQAVQVARELGDDRQEASGCTALGHALAALGRTEEAGAAYEHAFTLHHRMDQCSYALEPLAGLADLAGRRDLARAGALVEQILEVLDERELYCTDEALRIYLTCYRILHAGGDPRAPRLRQMAQTQVERRALTLDTDEMRQCFWAAPLHQIPMA